MAVVRGMGRRSSCPPGEIFACMREADQSEAQKGLMKSACQVGDCREVGCQRCHDCMIVLCSKHTAQHRAAPDTHGHTIESQEFVTSKSPHCYLHPELSNQHDQGEVFYCHACERVACRQCTCKSSSHSTGSLAEVADSRRLSLSTLRDENRDIIKADLMAYLQHVEDSLRAVSSMEAKLKVEINRFYDAQVLTINKERERLLGQVETVNAIQSHAFSNKIEWLQTVLASARSTLEFTDRSLEIAGDAELLAMYGPLSSRLQSLKDIGHGVGCESKRTEQLQVDFVVHQRAKEILHNVLARQGLASLRERLSGEEDV